MLIYDPLDLLSLGFSIGFIIVLITYVIMHATGKKIPTIKKGILITGALLIIIYTPTITEVSKIWLLLSLTVFGLILSNVLNTLYDLGVSVYQKYVSQEIVNKVTQIIPLSMFLLGLGLMAAGSQRVTFFIYNLTKQLILLCVGIWLALKLLYNKENCDKPL